MLAVFGRQMLISSSLTGTKAVAGHAKPPLDSEKIVCIWLVDSNFEFHERTLHINYIALDH